MPSKSTVQTVDATDTVAVPVVEAVEAPGHSQTRILAELLEDLALEAREAEPKLFQSKNTGLYVSKNIKAPDARALGLVVPTGGKVKLTIQAVVVDPANSKDA